MMLQNLRSKGVAVRVALLSVISLFISAGVSTAAITAVGNITSLTVSNDPAFHNSIYMFSISNGGTAEVTPWAADVVRVRYHFTGLWNKEEPMIAKQFSNWGTVTTSIQDQGTTYLIQTPQLNVIVSKTPFKVDFQDRASSYYLLQDDHMEFDSSYAYTGQRGSGASKIKCWKQVPSNQAFYGLGEFGGPLNRRNAGKDLECWAEGTYNWSEYNNPEYMNIPFFYGIQPANGSVPSYVYGLFFNNPCRPLFSFGGEQAATNSARCTFQAGDGQLDYFFMAGSTNHTMSSVVDRYSELTGRPTMLPKWAMGHHLSRFSYWCQSWVQYLADAATSSNMPLDAVYLDIDYMDLDDNPNAFGQLHQLWLNPNNDGNGTMCNHFPNAPAMVTYCGAKGVKIVPLIEPWLEPNDSLWTNAYNNSDFIKDNSGNQFQAGLYVNSNVSWFDWTSSAAQSRWETNIMNWYRVNGFAGIWNDTDEPESGDEIPSNGLLWEDGRYGTSTTDSRRQWSNEHNYFGFRTAQTSYQASLLAFPNKRPFVLSRSGTAGIQRYAVSWSGDTDADWTYARTCIRFGISAMISGAGYYGHDLGGFTGTVNSQPELLERWYEWGALLPLYRSHSRKGDDMWSNGDQGREPWRFAEPYQTEMRNDIQFRYKLMPYLYTLMYNSTQSGEPMNVPTAFQFYGDVNTVSLNDYDFLVGDYLLAAPVYTQGATTRSVYLPWTTGVGWYYWPANGQTRYGGGQTVSVSAPLGTLPLFVRSDAIIPMGPSMQYMGQFQPGYMDINCWPETSSSFTLYEDSGDGWDFTNGVYAMTTYTSSRTSTNWNFTIGARQGSYNPYSLGQRTNNIYVYNPQTVQSVFLNNSQITHAANNDFTAVLPCWFTTSDGKLAVRLLETGSQQNIRVNWNTSDPYNTMSVAGTFNGWNQAANNMQLVGANTWQFTTNFSNLGNFQFKFAANSGWGTNWGGTTTAQTVPASGSAILNSSTNILINGTFNGLYEFTFNDQTLAYSVVPLLASPYGAMSVAGTFNGWNDGASNMTLVANDTWQYDVTFNNTANVQFKFAAGAWLPNNWGDNNQTQFTPPMTGTGESFGSNIVVNGTLNGSYRFLFNDSTLQYSLQSLATDSVGDGILDSWRAQYFPTVDPTGMTTNNQSCATCDADGTGQNNYFKYVAGLDPTNPASIFILQIASVTGAPTHMNLMYNPIATGRTYTMQFNSDLVSGTYSNLTSGTAPQTNGNQVTITDLNATLTNEFYRVHISLP